MKHLSRKLLVALLAVSVALSLCAVSVFAGQQAVGVGTVTGEVARIRSAAGSAMPRLQMLCRPPAQSPPSPWLSVPPLPFPAVRSVRQTAAWKSVSPALKTAGIR